MGYTVEGQDYIHTRQRSAEAGQEQVSKLGGATEPLLTHTLHSCTSGYSALEQPSLCSSRPMSVILSLGSADTMHHPYPSMHNGRPSNVRSNHASEAMTLSRLQVVNVVVLQTNSISMKRAMLWAAYY
jgi:hypothetical protein